MPAPRYCLWATAWSRFSGIREEQGFNLGPDVESGLPGLSGQLRVRRDPAYPSLRSTSDCTSEMPMPRPATDRCLNPCLCGQSRPQPGRAEAHARVGDILPPQGLDSLAASVTWMPQSDVSGG